MTRIVLASTSATRAAILTAAGVPFETSPSGVDEETIKSELQSRGTDVRDIAVALADAKALAINPQAAAVVIGADQTLEFDGRLFDKTAGLAEARARLRLLRGQVFRLHTALAGARDGRIVWRRLETAQLLMRPFSDEFLDAYLSRNAPALASSLASFELEGEGAQLFEAIEGDYFAILGLPLLPLLAWLRSCGALAR